MGCTSCQGELEPGKDGLYVRCMKCLALYMNINRKLKVRSVCGKRIRPRRGLVLLPIFIDAPTEDFLALFEAELGFPNRSRRLDR